jgi:hypothetical protein
MEDTKNLFCSSKFPWAREAISLNLETICVRARKKVRQPKLKLSG